MLKFSALAKVNLYLEVTGKRADGYHLLDSLFAFVEGVADEITVENNDELCLKINGRFAQGLMAEQNNLVLRAAKLLQEKYNINKGAKIVLEKNLPIASGIGGGSADAAVTLKALNALWGIGLSEGELAKIGLGLGADVPACVYSRALIAKGIGEEITLFKQNLNKLFIVLVNPLKAVSTKEIFSQLVIEQNRKIPDFNGDLLATIKARSNDLEKPAKNICPEITQILTAFNSINTCLLARMSGSGATCFGLFDTLEQAKSGTELMQKKFTNWWVDFGNLV